MPKRTQDDMAYCMRVWKEWRECRVEKNAECITSVSKTDLQELLSHFILEIRKKNGSEYPPNTIYHICCGIMRFLRCNGQPDIDFFKDSLFSDFRRTLDSEMKRLQGTGLGSRKRQAEPLTTEEEEILWGSGQLGHCCPQALVDTMLYMCGIYFALRSGQEHRALRFDPSQIELVEKSGERAFLRYTEDVSKNNPGGLRGRKNKPKVVTHHENLDDPTRCFVNLYKMYRSKCPVDRPKHLQPLKKPKGDCWYSTAPIGHSTLAGTVSRICKAAGIKGYKTNHSLRATAATRLYQAGVDEQMIMEKTGHRSLEGVRSYKRTSSEQKENMSDILSLAKKPKCLPAPASSSLVPSTNQQKFLPAPKDVLVSSTNISNQQLMVHPDTLEHMFTLNSCANVNIQVSFNRST